MSEVYVTEDGCVAKYVHEDGSETSIKTWPVGMKSCGGSGRDKFNVFISSSVGCKVGCKFCFLTSKKYSYHHLTALEIGENVIVSIEEEFQRRPELQYKPMNLSFMGMGDAWWDLKKTYQVVKFILDNIQSVPIEGVDIATTLPTITHDDIYWLDQIKRLVVSCGRLTDRPKDRSPVRIFYSLITNDDVIRRKLIPNTLSIDVALSFLDVLKKDYNIITHMLLFQDVNDTCIENIIMAKEIGKHGFELRLLRFNVCPNSIFKESTRFDIILESLKNSNVKFKYQLSPGSEVAASCGMFLMKGENDES